MRGNIFLINRYFIMELITIIIHLKTFLQHIQNVIDE